MRFSPPPPGSLVEARAHLWTVQRVSGGPACAAVSLLGADPAVAGRSLTLLLPFDDLRPAARSLAPRRGPTSAALQRIKATVARALRWPVPQAAVAARLDLHPHQLSAALLLRAGRARRVLVADAVGTGKTVQAGIAIAQQIEDDPSARVLVVVPAALKGQWQQELRDRFGLQARVVEAVVPEAAGEPQPSPWAGRGVTMASFDYVKRIDVLGGLDAAWWHLLVVDEAHHVAGPSDRGAALRVLAARALRLLLLTATPDDGDGRRFAALCALGADGSGDRMAVLAREPHPAAGRGRRVHRRRVPDTVEDAHCRCLLDRYLEGIGARTADVPSAAALVASVLRKRAASSPAALARSAWRRRELASERPLGGQLALDFGGAAPLASPGAEEEDDDRVLGLALARDARHDRAWLGALAEAARRAAAHCGKLAALVRLLHRVGEPAVVFTEYRDTLGWLHAHLRGTFACEVIHGLQSPADRLAALEGFTRGGARVLLSTDAASEGLNLHARCRIVVMFDLPWMPIRLEQRIGRVDRLGQPRRVHGWTLHGEAPWEADLARRLEGRADAARAWRRAGDDEALVVTSVGAEERDACQRLARARAWHAVANRAAGAPTRSGERTARPVAARAPARRLRALGLPAGSTLAIVEASFTAGAAGVIERAVVAVRLDASWGPPAAAVRGAAALGRASQAAGEVAERIVDARRKALQSAIDACARVEAAARASVARALRASVTAHFAQPGLFDAPGEPSWRRDTWPPIAADTGPAAVTVLVTTPVLLMPRGRP